MGKAFIIAQILRMVIGFALNVANTMLGPIMDNFAQIRAAVGLYGMIIDDLFKETTSVWACNYGSLCRELFF